MQYHESSIISIYKGNQILIRRLHDVYISPTVQYNSSVWGQNIKMTDKRLFSIHQNITRIALNSLYRTGNPQYISFKERLYRLGMLKYDDQRQLLSIVFVIKIIKNETYFNLRDKITTAINTSRRTTRTPHLFNLDRINEPMSSPLYKTIHTMIQLRSVIDLNLSTQANKRALKLYYLDQYRH